MLFFLLLVDSLAHPATRDPVKTSLLQSPVRRHDGALTAARTWTLSQVTVPRLTHYIRAGTGQIKMEAIL